ncbi:MAG: DegQ family serine endoprotease [Rhodovibrionaceae bacterium]|nr:DegQ family serine endoprotease [Rhodovibrionaceae bacterium]
MTVAPTGLLAEMRKVPESRSEVLLSYAPVVEKVAPAVVNIYATRMVRERRLPSLFDDPFFKRFFGDRFGAPHRQREQKSLGSGVIVDPSGLVVTNHHVIAGAQEITVVLSDRREYEAEVILTDERTDLAVLRIEAPASLPYLEMRDSDDLQVGDLVLAIGNPFGVGQTVTSGIVSGLARTQVGITDYGFFIQTDAAINPGNSGGALVTMDGRLIGVNSAIYSRSGGSIGIGFAIPANMVRTVVAGARDGGEIVRPWSGLIGQTVTADLAEGMRLERPGGVVVSQIYPGGPADRAGLRRGDIIVAVDGRHVADFNALRFRLATSELGGDAEVAVYRDGRRLALSMPLRAPPETPPRDETLLSGRNPLSGARVVNLSPALAEELDAPGQWGGVAIIGVASRSPAQRFGFRPGDKLLAINGRKVDSVNALEDLLRRASGGWEIKLERDGRVSTLRVQG